MNTTPTPPAATTLDSIQRHEVRHSLAELRRELQLERHSGSYSMEKLDQTEIGKMFQNNKKRRAKKS